MRPWASVRCKSQPSPFRAIHCDVWPPRAIQLFVSFRDRSPVTIKLASHPGQPYAVKPRPPGPARLRSSLPHCVPLLFAWHLCSLHIGSSLRLALQFFALRLNRPPVTIKPATHVHQPYVVKVSFNQCVVFRRTAPPSRAKSRLSTCRIAAQSFAGHE